MYAMILQRMPMETANVMQSSRGRLWLERASLLVVVAATTIPLIEPLWVIISLLVQALSENLLTSLLGSLSLGLILILCYLGTRKESWRIISFLSRLFLLLFAIAVGMLFCGPFSVVYIVLGSASERTAVLALLCIATASFKFTLGLSVRYWLLLFVVLGMALLLMFVNIGVVTGAYRGLGGFLSQPADPLYNKDRQRSRAIAIYASRKSWSF